MERRRFQRLKTRMPLYGRALGSGAAIQGQLMNMSDGGFSFESAHEARSMDRYAFEITAPAEEGRPGARFEVRGQVRWCSPSEDDATLHWIGVMFLPSDDKQQGLIREFVALYTVPEG